MKIFHLGTVLGRLVKTQGHGVLIRQRQIETIAKRQQGLMVELLLLMRAHLALADRPHAVALLGLRQNDCRLTGMTQSGVIGGMDLQRIMSASAQTIDIGIRGQTKCVTVQKDTRAGFLTVSIDGGERKTTYADFGVVSVCSN